MATAASADELDRYAEVEPGPNAIGRNNLRSLAKPGQRQAGTIGTIREAQFRGRLCDLHGRRRIFGVEGDDCEMESGESSLCVREAGARTDQDAKDHGCLIPFAMGPILRNCFEG